MAVINHACKVYINPVSYLIFLSSLTVNTQYNAQVLTEWCQTVHTFYINNLSLIMYVSVWVSV